MADGTKIEWTDATWNPITGCAVVSPGCTNCYAMKLAGTRLRNHPSREGLTRDTKAGPVWTGEVRFNPQWLDEPLRWKKPRMIFVCAHGDLFAEGVPDEWIDQIFAVMALAPQHTFQVLTKRPERMRHYLCDGGLLDRLMGAACRIDSEDGATWSADICIAGDRGLPLPNVWLGVSVEDQKRADERIPILLDTPSAVRWISAEPLLGSLDLRAFLPGYIKGPKRAWDTFSWPQWVPEKVRKQVEDFWRTEYGRGPDAWLRSAIENGQHPMGTAGSYQRCTSKQELIEGRFIPAWNNIGRVVTEDGETQVVSHGIYRSRPEWLNWVVVGGESGRGARPMHPDWARSLRDQCAAAGVPLLFKQWGAFTPTRITITEFWNPATARIGELIANANGKLDQYPADASNVVAMRHVGKREAGRLLDGVEHNGFPEVRR
ncbi:phage Gp37/Gp68 family protein [Ensifer sp. ZNC0028]|uniref:phage Gp37/Gp68 family protein n=1 Tax=Ensifer sp. ZNC0028 TaxID=1339236 RepID=UPI0005B92ADC|nr:phage Gp37/Gp68 family protein [Ensifer sp. ZNC0028]